MQTVKLIELYKNILKYVKLEVDENGFVYSGYKSAVNSDSPKPTTVGGARLVLPLPENLKNYNPGKMIIFHPLCENILRGESDVLVAFRAIMNVRLNYTMAIIAKSLLVVCGNKEIHKNLTPEQAQLLYKLDLVDETTINNFILLMTSAVKKKPEGSFVCVILRKGISIRDKRYSRAGIIKFPILNELDNEEAPYGVKLRQKDIDVYKALLDFMLPGIAVQDTYSFGSDSTIAPSMEAIMMSSIKIASRLNDILEEYKDYIDGYEDLMFDSNWVDYFNDLDSLDQEIRRIPMQFGNEGGTKVAERNSNSIPVPTVPDPISPQSAQPQYAPAFAHDPHQHQQFQNPQNPTQHPHYQSQPPQPHLVKTDKGLDFKSVLSNNPSLAYGNPVTQRLYDQVQYDRSGGMPMQGQPYYAPQPQMQMQGQPYYPPQVPMQPQSQPYYPYPPQQPQMQGQPYYVPQGQMPMQPSGGPGYFNANDWRPSR